jgi:hypothetical protein
MRKYLFLLVLLSATYFFAFAQTPPQTKTATFLNNLNNFRQVFGDQGYPRATAADVAADDDVYASTKKLTSSTRTRHNDSSSSSLALQGFGFTIPEEAAIENISVKVRRFKKGGPAIKDHFVSVMRRYDCTEGNCIYGYMWRNGDVYPGNFYPDTETEYIFSQSGSGNNGGFNHDEAYQWTPAMVNHQYFGVRIDTYPTEGRSSVVVYYDLVEVTVEYSMPVTSRRAPSTTETKPFKEPIVYPNPFTTKTNIQFTAAESGNATLELYNINGATVRSVFSRNVVQGQVYNVGVGDAQLPKGIYVYRISNGKQKYTGRIIKLE